MHPTGGRGGLSSTFLAPFNAGLARGRATWSLIHRFLLASAWIPLSEFDDRDVHSAVSATTGFVAAARRAGRMPKTRPKTTAQPIAAGTIQAS